MVIEVTSSFQSVGKVYQKELPKQVLEDIIEETLHESGLLHQLEESKASGILDFFELDGYITIMLHGKEERYFYVTGLDSQAVMDWSFCIQQIVVFSIITIAVQYLNNTADADIVTKMATKVVTEKLN